MRAVGVHEGSFLGKIPAPRKSPAKGSTLRGALSVGTSNLKFPLTPIQSKGFKQGDLESRPKVSEGVLCPELRRRRGVNLPHGAQYLDLAGEIQWFPRPPHH